MKKLMVVGFLFSKEKKEVVLIRKTHPEWQKDKWNGVGGHVKQEFKDGILIIEHYDKAMEREFEEETGVLIDAEKWEQFLIMEGADWLVVCFKSFSDQPWQDTILHKLTDEEPVWCDITCGLPSGMISNLKWLIPVALDETFGPYTIEGAIQ